ncbi:hypothetical protein DH2020_018506 [Rehmannia glutinosa]|uniref:CCHC-type domain-containing protein n=1 Tax=Rehmannia glutinosa TaxID=99300 RepID=A0ABR0WKJ4_REHGL
MAEDLNSLYAKLSLGEKESSSLSTDGTTLDLPNSSLSLVGKLLAPRVISLDQVSSLFKRLWNPKKPLTCKSLHDNVFLFSFESLADKKRISLSAPWLFDRSSSHGALSGSNYMGFPLDYSQKVLPCAGNFIGKFLEVQTDSTGSVIGKFLRIKVEIDIQKPLCRVIQLDEKFQKRLIGLKYERLPDFCFHCGKLGHILKDCDEHVLNGGSEKSELEYGNWLRASSLTNPFSSNRQHPKTQPTSPDTPTDTQPNIPDTHDYSQKSPRSSTPIPLIEGPISMPNDNLATPPPPNTFPHSISSTDAIIILSTQNNDSATTPHNLIPITNNSQNLIPFSTKSSNKSLLTSHSHSPSINVLCSSSYNTKTPPTHKAHASSLPNTQAKVTYTHILSSIPSPHPIIPISHEHTQPSNASCPPSLTTPISHVHMPHSPSLAATSKNHPAIPSHTLSTISQPSTQLVLTSSPFLVNVPILMDAPAKKLARKFIKAKKHLPSNSLSDTILPLRVQSVNCIFSTVIILIYMWCLLRLLERKPNMMTLNRDFDRLKNVLGFFGVSVPPVGRSGGLALLWRQNVDVSLRGFNNHFIDAHVSFATMKFRFTGVYGQPNISQRRAFWNSFKNLFPRTNEPWICMGDFNEVLRQNEFVGSRPRASWQISLFRDAIDSCDLSDMGFCGSRFTWHRLLAHPRTQRARLDRCLCNPTFRTVFPWYKIYNIPSFTSDHVFVLTRVEKQAPQPNHSLRRKPQRFESYWVKSMDCKRIIQEAWSSSPPALNCKLQSCLAGLVQWNRSQYGDLTERINKIKVEISQLEKGRITDQVKHRLCELHDNLDSLLELNDMKWKQRAKQHWYKNGDRNTAFFHAYASKRRATNHISSLLDNHGQSHTDTVAIERIITAYFENIFHSVSPSSHDIQHALSRIRPRVTKDMADCLTCPSNFFAHSVAANPDMNATVSSLIDPLNATWKEQVVRSLFSSDEASLIFSIPIASTPLEDLWCWHHNKNGKFTVKSAYHIALTSATLFPELQASFASGSSPNPVWKKIWHLKIPPRFKLFAWRCCSEAIPTMDFLGRHHIDVSDDCKFCPARSCDASHIFFLCPFAGKTWAHTGLKDIIWTFLQSSFSLWYKEIILNSPAEVSNMFVVITNLIWFHRNKKKFENTTCDPFYVAAAANIILQDFQKSYLHAADFPRSPSDSTLSGRFPRIYFDGAIAPYNSCGGVGIAYFDKYGNFIHGLSKKFSGINDPEVAETLALREALKLANTLNIGPIFICGDAAQVILAATGEASCPASCSGILQDILSLKASVSLQGIVWIRRSANFVAHTLANFAKHMSHVCYLWDHLPDPVCQSLLDDFQHL